MVSSAAIPRVSRRRYLQVLVAEVRYLFGLSKLLRSAHGRFPTFPALVEIQTVNRCNAQCPMCPYPETMAQQTATTMSDATYTGLLDQLAAEPEFKALVLGLQNEPLVDPDLVRRARQFKQLMPDRHLEIVTNGSLLDEPRVADLYAAFDLISVSVNAHSHRTHRQVFGNDSFDQVLANLERIAARPAWVDRTVLRFVRDGTNDAEYGEFKTCWNRRGFRVFGFDANTRLNAVVPFATGRARTLPARLRQGLWRRLGRVLMPCCTVPDLTSYIRANGDVALCFNDYSDRNILGSVARQTIGEVFRSAEVAAIRERVRTHRLQPGDVCADCDLYNEGTWATF